jgi:hypothetical protein
MAEKTEEIAGAAAILAETRKKVPGAGDKLIILINRYKIAPNEIGSTKAEVKSIARYAIIERYLAFMNAFGIFQTELDILIAAAEFNQTQQSLANRLSRCGPTKTLTEEAKALQII